MKKLIVFIFFSGRILFSQWSNDPSINLQLTYGGDYPISAISDNKGGAFVTYGYTVPTDSVPYFKKMPYLIHVDKYGYHKLDTVVYLGGYGSKISYSNLIPSDNGNFIYSYLDELLYEFVNARAYYQNRVRLQKFDSQGNALWDKGLDISQDSFLSVINYEIVSDRMGGCFVYYDAVDTTRTSRKGKRLLQHIDNNGNKLLGTDGLILYDGDVTWTSFSQKLLLTNDGGVLVHHFEDSSQPDTSFLSYVNQNGEQVWKMPSEINLYGAKMFNMDNASFGLVGFFIKPTTYSKTLLYYKIDQNGNSIGTPTVLLDSIQTAKRIEWANIINDSIYFFWLDEPTNLVYKTYFQKLDHTGKSYYGDYGIEVLDPNNIIHSVFENQDSLTIVSYYFAQKIDLYGNNVWNAATIEYTNRDMTYASFVSDNNGGFLAFWHENVQGIWGQQVNKNGKLGQVVTSIDYTHSNLLQNFKLNQNYPNPFNPTTEIEYYLAKSEKVSLKIFDVLGKEITTLVDEVKTNGYHKSIFDASNLASGIYYYVLSTPSIYETKKMVYLK